MRGLAAGARRARRSCDAARGAGTRRFRRVIRRCRARRRSASPRAGLRRPPAMPAVG
ncbi:hypothetical protein BURMUCGD1_4762 [Burkholderia multivorans CGD1]|nr:hypothetical protein BURMUCGD1_4762 [Burkholderia multivorans CGD1]